MLNETRITITGRLGNDPELRFTKTGKAIANLSVAHQPRKHDNGQWTDDGNPQWYSIRIWGHDAEATIDQLHKGDRVIILGRIASTFYVDAEGTKHAQVTIDADEIGITMSGIKLQTPPTQPAAPDPWNTQTPF